MPSESELESLETLHNVCTMSNLSTPTRLGRGLAIPGIDTKPSLDDAARASSHGGLHTPPQSAHESRRPSLQYSIWREAPSSATSSTFAYSHPSTPVHDIGHNADCSTNGWPGSSSSHNGHVLSDATTVDTGPFAGTNLDQAFEHRPSTVHAATFCSPSQESDMFGFSMGTEVQMTETWRPAPQMIQDYITQSTCLGPALFAAHTPSQPGAVAPYDHLAQSFNGVARQYDPTSLGGLPSSGTNFYYQQPPQVVVPSQLSPGEDYVPGQLGNYTQTQPATDNMTGSFPSSEPDLLDYGLVSPPSSAEAYFAHSEDEDYTMIKSEATAIEMNVHAMRGYQDASGQSRRPKRRSSRRLRNGEKGAAWHSHVNKEYNCLVQCEGKGFTVQRDGSIKVEISTSRKPHECRHTFPDGKLCGRRFDRSEHLNRHARSHSGERDYPCPLPNCGKMILRPDNAKDHFRTHLKPRKKGNRNSHVAWDVLEHAIQSTYTDQKRAKKVLDGLRKWIENGMPEPPGSRRAAS